MYEEDGGSRPCFPVKNGMVAVEENLAVVFPVFEGHVGGVVVDKL